MQSMRDGMNSGYDNRENPRLTDGRLRVSGQSYLNMAFRRFVRGFRAVHQARLLSSRVFWGLAFVVSATAILTFYGDAERNSKSMIASISSSLGLNATELLISGNQHISSEEIASQLNEFVGQPMLLANVDAMRSELEGNRWIKSAVVKKIYPSTLSVKISERLPVALWKSRDALIVVDTSGYPITRARIEHMHLPQVVGEGANDAASDLLQEIAKYPHLVAKMNAYVRVADRRWNLVFHEGPDVLLPAKDWRLALKELDLLQRQRQILDRQILHIDMRLVDRLILRLDATLASDRREAVENMLKREWSRS